MISWFALYLSLASLALTCLWATRDWFKSPNGDEMPFSVTLFMAFGWPVLPLVVLGIACAKLDERSDKSR